MVGLLGAYTQWDQDARDQSINDNRSTIWGEIPGTILEVDYAKQTAKIKPEYKIKLNGKPTQMADLFEVPLRFLRAAGGAAFTWPVKKDDKVTLRPQMRNTEKYHDEQDYTAGDARNFNPSDYEAHLSGGESLKDPIQNFDQNNIHWRWNKEGTKGMKANPTTGDFEIDMNKGTFKFGDKEGVFENFDKIKIKMGSKVTFVCSKSGRVDIVGGTGNTASHRVSTTGGPSNILWADLNAGA